MSEEFDEVQYAGFWKRAWAGLIDGIISMILFWPLTLPMMKWQMANKSILPSLFLTIVFTAVLVFLVIRFGGTPGKLIMNVRIVDSSYSYLMWPRALLRMVFPGLIIDLNSLLQLLSTFQYLPSDLSVFSMTEIGSLAANIRTAIYNSRYFADSSHLC